MSEFKYPVYTRTDEIIIQASIIIFFVILYSLIIFIFGLRVILSGALIMIAFALFSQANK